MPKIIERFSPLFNISTFFYMLKWNYLHVKRTNMYFHGLCYTPAKAIWVPKHFCPKKRCLSLSLSLSLSISLYLSLCLIWLNFSLCLIWLN